MADETVFLALGSNVGDRKAMIEEAVRRLRAEIHDLALAPLYLTRPFGVHEQNDFMNTAVKGRTDLTPRELLYFVKGVERAMGRRERFRWGPREIDIDIVLYGNQIVLAEDLQIPHPGLAERDFVLRPLLDLEPDLVHPVHHCSLRQLYDALPEPARTLVEE